EEKEAAEAAARAEEARLAAEREQRRIEREAQIEAERVAREAKAAAMRTERAAREAAELAVNPHATMKLTSPKTAEPYIRAQLKALGAFPQAEGFGKNKVWVWHVPLKRASEARRILGED